MATISCTDCGAERKQCPKNTLYCKACRLLRDLDHWTSNRRQCRDCRAAFAPIGRTDYRCSSCHPGSRLRQITCVLCRTDGAPLLSGIPVCDQCLRAPAKRKKLFEALQRGQAQRRQERNDATT
jgi:hypothetical protein